jgi:hypothetical protein
MNTQLLAATIAAGVSLTLLGAGWWWAARRENRARRIERTLARLERQIGDFYGPLLGLIEEYLVIEHVEKKIIEAGRAGKLDQDKRAIVRRFIYEEFKRPIHDRFSKILDERLYLVEGGNVHESLREYLKSAVQQAIQYRLWAEKKIPTDFLQGYGFPTDFAEEVKIRLRELLERQDRIVHGREMPEGWSG